MWLLANVPAAKAATYAYVNPVIALLLGWWFLDEPITPPIVIGSAIIVIAVALVTTARVPRPIAAAAPERVPPTRSRNAPPAHDVDSRAHARVRDETRRRAG